MTAPKGMVALMGSGELTATMVEVHKELLGRLGASARAVFLDTPAGFQLNSDEISRKAVEYFRDRVRWPMSVASLKTAEADPSGAERAFRELGRADYILVGPGSPTYALRQWRRTPVPQLFVDRVVRGACLVAASAAALTVGRFTLPVYEIYKVGEDPHWVEGLDVLGSLGLELVVVPHWNNAEGGTHDTRYCYLGEPRFRRLEQMLPGGLPILGIDEHTACLVDLETRTAEVRGVGRVTVRCAGAERSFAKGERFPLDRIRGEAGAEPVAGPAREPPAAGPPRRDEAAGVPDSAEEHLRPVVEAVLALRARWRGEGRWEDADALRECLEGQGITVEDTREGFRWRLHG